MKFREKIGGLLLGICATVLLGIVVILGALPGVANVLDVPTSAPIAVSTGRPAPRLVAAATVPEPPGADGDSSSPPAPPPARTPPSASSPATAPIPPAAAAPGAALLVPGQLDRLLAPIALYPDQLLDQVLMASTYPLEIVEAARWVKVPANRALKGDALMAALKANHWDPSVMALVPFPRLLDTMSDKIGWTEELGNAFLAQQSDVMTAVQRLRRAAMAAGSLRPAICRCVVQQTENAIVIQPANPSAVYVPTCNPQVAYGPWPYPLYPPVVFPVPAGFVWQPVPFIGFYPAVELSFYGPLWGWGWFDWRRHDIVVNTGAFDILSGGRRNFAGNIWVHNPAHRGGVAYADPAVAARFGGRVAGARAALRGRAGVASGLAGRRGTMPRGGFAARGGAGHGTAILRGRAAHAGLRGYGRERIGGRAGFRGGRAHFARGGAFGGRAGFRGGRAHFARGGAFRGRPHAAMRGGFGGGSGPHFAIGGGGSRGGGRHGGGPHGGGGHGGGPHGGGGHGRR